MFGKTTILRDLIRKLSNGIEQINYHGINIGVVDERGEIAAMYRGVPQNDVGIRTDVLDNVTKALGMTMLIRSMSPKVIVADEIGNKDEVEPIMQAVCSGIKGIFTAHGASIEDIKINPTIRELINNGVFERIIFLSDKKEKGEIEKIYVLNKIEKQYVLYNCWIYIFTIKCVKCIEYMEIVKCIEFIRIEIIKQDLIVYDNLVFMFLVLK